MRRAPWIIALALTAAALALPAPAQASWGERLTLTDSSAPSDVKVKIKHQHGQAINVSSTTTSVDRSAQLLRVIWHLRRVDVPGAKEKLSFAWFDGPESAESRFGLINVVLVGGKVVRDTGCAATTVRVRPRVRAVVVKVPYACFDTPHHKARLLTITPMQASLSTLTGQRISSDNPLKSPGAPVKPGVSVSLGRS